ncbi:MAG: DUF2849 domain-containing protein [Pseudomonadota bacterium]
MSLLKTPITFTGNRLLDGEVVWLGRGGQWVEDVEGAFLAKTEDERMAAAALADKADAENHVVEPYEIEATVEQGIVTPVRFREKIRAAGPTIRTDLGKQAQRQERAA